MRFRDRGHAGAVLARAMARPEGEGVVLALPRGGVPVGAELASAFGLPLDVFLVRKLGVPGHEELAMGAVASGGVLVLNDDVVQGLRIPEGVIEEARRRELAELTRRERAYRDGRPPAEVRGKSVILVDDGLATGASMMAAVKGLKTLGPGRIVVAVPVGSTEACARLRRECELICAIEAEEFFAVGSWYDDFTQTTDQEVQALLASQVTGAMART